MITIKEKERTRIFGKGTTVRVWENNGYDDSDFFAEYLDLEGKWQETMYATTRAYTYHNHATVDATDKVKELYRLELERRDRVRRINVTRLRVAEIKEIAGELPRIAIEKLLMVWEVSKIEKECMLSLLKVKTFRSSFRKSLREQLDIWLREKSPKYDSPFSDRQWQCLIAKQQVRKW